MTKRLHPKPTTSGPKSKHAATYKATFVVHPTPAAEVQPFSKGGPVEPNLRDGAGSY